MKIAVISAAVATLLATTSAQAGAPQIEPGYRNSQASATVRGQTYNRNESTQWGNSQYGQQSSTYRSDGASASRNVQAERYDDGYAYTWDRSFTNPEGENFGGTVEGHGGNGERERTVTRRYRDGQTSTHSVRRNRPR